MGLCNSKKSNITETKDIIILSVEDDEFHYKLIEFVLKSQLKFKYKLLWTDNGNEGYEIIKNVKPDIVILDRMLNGIQGDEVIKKLVSNKIDYNLDNIIVSSNKTELQDYITISKLGVPTYIPKPININLLIETINSKVRNKIYK